MTSFTAVVEQDRETGLYIGVVPGLPGAHTQAATLDELRVNLEEVVALVLEEDASLKDSLPRFVGVQQIEIA
jgi:predicted RNase H-like HicB family nuclease